MIYNVFGGTLNLTQSIFGVKDDLCSVIVCTNGSTFMQ